MTDKDIVIASTLNIPVGGMIASKPAYLVSIEPEGKNKNAELFLSVEMPDVQSSFIRAKGFFLDAKEYETSAIVAGYKTIIASQAAESFVEVWLPWHRISCMRSLVFKKDKK